MRKGSHRFLDVTGAHCGRRCPLNHAFPLPRGEGFSWTCGWPARATFPLSLTARGGQVTKGELIGCKRKLECAIVGCGPQSIIVPQLSSPCLWVYDPWTQLPPLNMDKPWPRGWQINKAEGSQVHKWLRGPGMSTSLDWPSLDCHMRDCEVYLIKVTVLGGGGGGGVSCDSSLA